MDDPRPKSLPLQLTASADELYQAYYQSIVEYLSSAIANDTAESVEVEGIDFKVVHDPDLDLFVGLAGPLLATGGANSDVVRATVSVCSPDESGQ